MPHQCLNCGKTIPKGSDEILKGCQQCGGKKFIYVNTPLPHERRMDLIKQAETVRADLIRKADPELLRVLKERGVTELDGSTLQLEPSPEGDWLRITPRPEAPKTQVPAPLTAAKGTVAGPSAIEEGPKKPSAKEIIFEFDRGRQIKPGKAEGPIEERKGAKVRAKAEKRPSKPKKRVLKRPERKAAGRKVREGPPPLGTVNVIEQGVYEIDVERLLRDDPVIIENDGTYLIHLPSLLRSRSEGSQKRAKTR